VQTRSWRLGRAMAATIAFVAAAVALVGCSVAAPSVAAPSAASSSVAGSSAAAPSVAAPWVPGARSYPDGCPAYGLSPKRCAAIVAWATDQLPANHAAIVGTALLPDLSCAGQPAGVLCMRTTQSITTVRFTLADGSVHDYPLFCGVGGQFTLLCSDRPQIEIGTAVDHDVPCPGTDPGVPGACATPFPSPDPAILAASRPLRVATLDIPVTRTGHHELVVGQAVLPHGYVTEATFALVDDAPAGLLLSGPLELELRSTIPGRPPFGNVYERGIFPGVEAVEVLLVFDVAETAPGVVIGVRDLVVR
jgi:hypothetical protein